MSLIQFINAAPQPICSANAPVVLQYNVVHQGADAIDESSVVTSVVDLGNPWSGDAAYKGGQVVNRGCKDLILTLTFLDGDDCDYCTSDTVVVVQETVIVPANTSLELPNAYWQAAEYLLSSDLIVGEGEQNVYIYSAFAPDCPGCKKIAIDTAP